MSAPVTVVERNVSADVARTSKRTAAHERQDELVHPYRTEHPP